MNIGIERSLQSLDLLTFVYIFVFVVLTLVKLQFPRKFLSLCSCFFSKSFFTDYSNELTATFSLFKGALFLVQNLIFSIFFYTSYRLIYPDTSVNEISLFFQIFGGVSVFLILKYSIGLVVAKIFQFSGFFMSVHALKFSYLKVISFVLLPLLLYQNYALSENEQFVGVVVAVLFALLLLIKVILIVVKNNNVIIERLFYFIVYLCTLEIVPLILVYKLVVDK